MLQENQTNSEEMILSSALREGCAVLQGLLICGNCGHKISPRYKGKNGVHPMYECNKAKRDGQASSYCMAFRADAVDQVVVKRILEILERD